PRAQFAFCNSCFAICNRNRHPLQIAKQELQNAKRTWLIGLTGEIRCIQILPFRLEIGAGMLDNLRVNGS
ncbi:MAG: hypothetical protein L0211_08810, partial [Planctomycetaceae bacterium]|nr:hypothetical protein [Planctomycetaceae bacterium]